MKKQGQFNATPVLISSIVSVQSDVDDQPYGYQAFHIYWHFRLRLFSYLLGLS